MQVCRMTSSHKVHKGTEAKQVPARQGSAERTGADTEKQVRAKEPAKAEPVIAYSRPFANRNRLTLPTAGHPQRSHHTIAKHVATFNSALLSLWESRALRPGEGFRKALPGPKSPTLPLRGRVLSRGFTERFMPTCLAAMTAEFTGPRRTGLISTKARRAAPCATHDYPAS